MGLPTRPPGQWARAVIYLQGDQKEWSIDFWFTITGGPVVVADQSANADIIVANLLANLQGILSFEVVARGGYVEFSDGATTIGNDSYQSITGAVSDPALPYDVAAVVSKISSQVGRSARGRIYLAGIPETFSDGSYLSILGNTSLLTFTAAIATDITNGPYTFKQAHFSRKLGQIRTVVLWEHVALLGTRRRRRGPF